MNIVGKSEHYTYVLFMIYLLFRKKKCFSSIQNWHSVLVRIIGYTDIRIKAHSIFSKAYVDMIIFFTINVLILINVLA